MWRKFWIYSEKQSPINFNPFMPAAAKTAWQFWWFLANKSNIWILFEGELFIRTLSTTLHQIIWKLMLHSKIIFKSMMDPAGQVILQARKG